MSAPPGGAAEPAEPVADGLRQRAVRGVLWNAVEKWSVRLSTLIGFVVLGNLLTPEAFGVVALAMTFISLLTTVTDAGFAAYLIQLRRLTDASTSTAFYTSSAMALVLAGILAAAAPLISGWLDTPELERVIPALAVALVIAGLSSVPATLLRRELRFKELAVRQVAATVLSVAVAVGLALAGAGVWALVGQTLVRSVVALVVLWATSDFRPRRLFDRTEARAMTSYGSKSVVVHLGNQVNSEGQTFLIGALAGPVALGYWAIASRLVNVVVEVCTSIIGTVANPVFARLQGDGQRLARALGTAMALAALVTVPVLVCLSLTSREVVPAVFGSQWVPAAALAAIVTVRGVLRSLSGFGASVLMATGHPSAELVATATLVVVQLSLVALFHDDLVVMAVALTVGTGLTIPIRIVQLRRLLGVPLRTYAATASVLLAAGVAAAAVLGVQELAQLQGAGYVVMAVVVGGVVYAGAVLLVSRPVVADLLDMVRPALARRRGRRAVPAGQG